MSFASYEIGRLEQKIIELEAEVTIRKGERDEYKRQRDEVLEDIKLALDGWYHCATCVVEDGDEIEAEKTQIAELRKKHHLERQPD